MKEILAGGPVQFQAAKGHQEGLRPGVRHSRWCWVTDMGRAGPRNTALVVRPRATRMHTGTAQYSTTLPPDTRVQRNSTPA